MIGRLYVVEKHIREARLNGKAARACRIEQAKPVVDKFFTWIDKQFENQGLLPSSPLTKAMAYARERRAGLEVYLNDPEVAIDTNHLERALRVVPMGRKNWLFCWTEVGAKYVGVIQSLISTCRLHGSIPTNIWSMSCNALVSIRQARSPNSPRGSGSSVSPTTPAIGYLKARAVTRAPLGYRLRPGVSIAGVALCQRPECQPVATLGCR